LASPPSVCNDAAVKLRGLLYLMLCLAFLGTRVTGLHFHASEVHDHHKAGLISSHDAHDSHASHLTSDLAADHLAGHAENDESDVGSDAGLTAKLPLQSLPILFLVTWLAFALLSLTSAGLRVPIRWLRPPDFRRWPIQLLPPSQGPPRAV